MKVVRSPLGDPDEDDPSAGACRVDRLPGRVHVGDVEDDVDAVRSVQGRAGLLGGRGTVRQRVDGHDRGRADRQEQPHEQQPERAATEHGGRRPRPDSPRSTAWTATPSGSSSVASASGSVSGSGWSRFSGHATSDRSAPSVEPWPANRSSAQRCGCPARHIAQRPHVIAGSTATRSTARGPDLDDADELVSEDERLA